MGGAEAEAPPAYLRREEKRLELREIHFWAC